MPKPLPPLVTSWEVERLKENLAAASRGEMFLLQGGDCSETFEQCQSDFIARKLKILLKMSVVLTYGGMKPVIRVGRIAGQYAKPRSAPTETRDGVTLPSYRGNLINRPEFTPDSRTPDPALLLRAYERAAMTINFIRGLVGAGFADLRHPELWDLGFVDFSTRSQEYRHMMQSVGEAVSFLEAVGGQRLGGFDRVDFYTSHEGLHLDYEQAQTRRVPRRSGWYDLTAHFPWIGERTRDPGGAHVEFFRGIQNPIGVKVGPTMQPDELIELIYILNPDNEPGRITLIQRFGATHIEKALPPLIDAISRSGRSVLWSCDPMHGNTETMGNGIKTRSFDTILKELDSAFEIHQRMRSILGGVHFELTGENVTECIGGARGLAEEDLKAAYMSDVDPRMNYDQALETALLISRRMRAQRKG